ncbi:MULTISPECIES: universal stress protein [unclassified Paraburkholderia]|uniref:universal stress protein n=1 Tax=unclassified Paraburkholderia TaxID=2615204 RepID=UPI001609FC28|nr:MULTISPECIES: universal stress protein [unclassified Paraburkholderia]MBB5444960.1 nucleotide-binding universal stress UspA family protein [Paraburkholderia sp. WSM4177]MBB5483891.1 nucleotide-binding universal stress UspA family protein [Paraburkholderia sp. WSM4180]
MFHRLLVALDGSDTASRAFDAALTLAAESGAELQPLYVIDVPVIAYDAPGFDPCVIQDAFIDEGKRIAADAQSRMTARGIKGTARSVEAAITGEDVAHRIVEAALEWHADAIVMGTHGRRGVQRLMLGSVAERVLRSASCPVLMVPAHANGATRDQSVPACAENELT